MDRHTIMGIILGSFIGWFLFQTFEKYTISTGPIFNNMVAQKTEEKEGALFVLVKGDKYRKCTPITITASDGNQLIDVKFLDDKTKKGFNIPDANGLGTNINFGIWKLSPTPNLKTTVFTTFHDCDGETVKTPFRIKQ